MKTIKLDKGGDISVHQAGDLDEEGKPTGSCWTFTSPEDAQKQRLEFEEALAAPEASGVKAAIDAARERAEKRGR